MELESAARLTPISSMLGLGGPFRKGMVFLINFAWASRIRLPILILVGFMVFDIRMQLEINVDVELRQVAQDDLDSDDDDSTDEDNTSEYFDSDDEDEQGED